VSDARYSRLIRRALHEQRPLVLATGALLLLNAVVYAAVIYPLSSRVNSVTERTQLAETELANARLARTRAESALTGKSQASRKLEVFYREVLPAGLPEARQMMHPRLEQIARAAGLEARSSNWELETERGRLLTQVVIDMDLAGGYREVRDFIHRLERAPEFLVIDRIALQESDVDDEALALKLKISTFYRGGGK
jgi:hypothetical protein